MAQPEFPEWFSTELGPASRSFIRQNFQSSIAEFLANEVPRVFFDLNEK
jgi:hypothetical protein